MSALLSHFLFSSFSSFPMQSPRSCSIEPFHQHNDLPELTYRDENSSNVSSSWAPLARMLVVLNGALEAVHWGVRVTIGALEAARRTEGRNQRETEAGRAARRSIGVDDIAASYRGSSRSGEMCLGVGIGGCCCRGFLAKAVGLRKSGHLHRS